MSKKDQEAETAASDKALPSSTGYLEEMGRRLTEGAITTVGKYLLYAIAFLVVLTLFVNFMGWGVDNSDASAWERSGLRIYTDHLTGVQYVSDGNSLTVRVHPDGSPVLSR